MAVQTHCNCKAKLQIKYCNVSANALQLQSKATNQTVHPLTDQLLDIENLCLGLSGQLANGSGFLDVQHSKAVVGMKRRRKAACPTLAVRAGRMQCNPESNSQCKHTFGYIVGDVSQHDKLDGCIHAVNKGVKGHGSVQ
jgi:hypothetical protein